MSKDDEDFVVLEARSEEEFFEEINKLCLDKRDPLRACQARGLKRLHPAFHNWVQDEYERGTDPNDMKRAIAPVLINLVAQGASSLSEGKYKIVMAWGILHDMGLLFKDFYRSGKAQGQKGD